MRKGKQTTPGQLDKARVTPEQLGPIVNGWIMQLMRPNSSDDAIAEVLLVLRTLAEEPDADARENLYIAAETAALPLSVSAGKAVEGVIAKYHAKLTAACEGRASR
jgi:hypothetical protein